jgi:hypothetical protein
MIDVGYVSGHQYPPGFKEKGDKQGNCRPFWQFMVQDILNALFTSPFFDVIIKNILSAPNSRNNGKRGIIFGVKSLLAPG